MPVLSGVLKPKSRRRNVVTAQKVILQVPKPLLLRADHLADELQTNRSNLIRIALEEKIERCEQERLDAELREGYLAMNELRVREHKDFEAIVSEILSTTERKEPSLVG